MSWLHDLTMVSNYNLQSDVPLTKTDRRLVALWKEACLSDM